MNKPTSVGLLIVGVILLGFAAFSGDSVSSGFSKLFQGTPDNRTIILLVLGVLALAAGLVGVVRPRT
jgi:hypothetical protein